MTQPAPAPTQGSFGGITLTVPDTSGSGADLYGVGAWGDQTVNPGDLPFLTGLIASGKKPTGTEIVKAFAGASPTDLATVQHAMLMAGYYPKTFTPRYGVISPDDLAAFTKAVQVAGQAGTPVSTLLEQGAAYGAAAGIAAAQAEATGQAQQARTVTVPNTQDLKAVAEAAFEKVLGKKPSQKEAAAFAAMYQAMAVHTQTQGDTPGLAGPLAQGDPGELADAAMSEQTQPMSGPVLDEHLRPQVDQDGRLVQPMTGPVTDETQRPLVDANTGQPVQPSFSSQIGGLMSLGQALNQAQTPDTPGGVSTVESLEDPSVAAENYARSRHPKQAGATDLAGQFQNFLSILSRGF